jgi:hypothetical protein
MDFVVSIRVESRKSAQQLGNRHWCNANDHKWPRNADNANPQILQHYINQNHQNRDGDDSRISTRNLVELLGVFLHHWKASSGAHPHLSADPESAKHILS